MRYVPTSLTAKSSTLNGAATGGLGCLRVVRGEPHEIRGKLAGTVRGGLEQFHKVFAIDKVLLGRDLQLFPERLDLATDRDNFLANRIAGLVIQTRAIQDGRHFCCRWKF